MLLTFFVSIICLYVYFTMASGNQWKREVSHLPSAFNELLYPS